MRPILNAFFASTLLLFPSSALAATIHIPGEYSSIQAGVDAAVDGDIVLVGPGTYVENINIEYKLLTLESEDGANATVLDGGQNGLPTISYYWPASLGGLAVIDGFTITNGKYSHNGGGLSVGFGPTYGGTNYLTITDCLIIGNSSDKSGGGIYIYQLMSANTVTITNCSISDNYSQLDGGGLYYMGGGESSITSCEILNNYACEHGGGIFCEASGFTISDCTIAENHSESPYTYGGGGLFLDGSETSVINTIISRNTSAKGGGGIVTFGTNDLISFCTISDNEATHLGGGIFGLYDSHTAPIFENCIIWGNFAPAHPQIYGQMFIIEYCDVQGGWPGEGNINADPLFVGGSNYHLTADSPCIDSGFDAGIYLDFDGDRRPIGAGFDMGADEFSGECSDGDGDGFSDMACGGLDCDDTDVSVHPDAEEICDNGIDDDCDELIDQDDPDCDCIDLDGDGYGDPASAECVFPQWDCDDTDPFVNPGAQEGPQTSPYCSDGIDNDCDGLADAADPDCTPVAPCSALTAPSHGSASLNLMLVLGFVLLGRRLFSRLM